MFNITGSQAAPVRNVTVRGLEIRDTALTYLGTDVADKHSMPSGQYYIKPEPEILKYDSCKMEKKMKMGLSITLESFRRIVY